MGRVKIYPLSFCLGVTLIGSGCAIVYLLVREVKYQFLFLHIISWYDIFLLSKQDQEFDDEPQQQNKRRRTFTELKISKEKVGHLIGRNGANIKEIQEKTATRITFKDEGN